MRNHFVSGFACVVLLGGCAASAPPPATAAATLEGTQWTLRDFEGQPASERPLNLRFDAGQLSGRAPCNTISARYTRDGDSLRLGPIASSKMYCADASALENAYLEALRGVDRATISGDTLTLSGNGARLAYVAAATE